jgi:hypothetical protein
MKMTGADERELEDLKRRVTKVERRVITLAAFTVSTFSLWLALIIYQVFLLYNGGTVLVYLVLDPIIRRA